MISSTLNAPQTARQAIRNKTHQGHTVGLAPGHVQGNLMILPESMAMDFLRFCQQNPAPCPVLAVSNPGDPFLPTLGKDIDIRHDIPQYRIWKDGVLVEEPYDIEKYWQKDMVSFIIGCSFSFEEALIEEGIPLRHNDMGCNVSMYRTNIETSPAGMFHGPMVVSMRPLKPADAIRAVQITSRFPKVHGAPVHIGHPESIGIKDLSKPDFGDAVEVKDDELPVFWACGVTPQSIAMASKPPICITHAPGCMLVTDLINHQLASF